MINVSVGIKVLKKCLTPFSPGTFKIKWAKPSDSEKEHYQVITNYTIPDVVIPEKTYEINYIIKDHCYLGEKILYRVEIKNLQD